MLQKLLSSVHFGVQLIFGASSRRLLKHEGQIFDAVVDSLPSNQKSLVKQQLAAKFLIDRSNPRVNFIPIGELPAILQILEKPLDDALFKVNFVIDGKKEIANVTFYRGFIFSVETKRHRKFYKDSEIIVIGVEPGKPSQSMTNAINRQEHGRDGAP
jgi:hypothetical protein